MCDSNHGRGVRGNGVWPRRMLVLSLGSFLPMLNFHAVIAQDCIDYAAAD